MAKKPITMLQIRRILQLFTQQISIRGIAKQCELSRNTVRDYLKLIDNSQMSAQQLMALDDSSLSSLLFDGDKSLQKTDERYQYLLNRLPVLVKELGGTGVTRQLLWQEYLILCPDGYGYTQFCHYLSEHVKQGDTVMYFVQQPAQKMLVDFAGKKLTYVNDQGKEVYCQVFVAVLPYSGYTYVEAVHTQNQSDFLQCLRNALQYFGGAPACIVSDNLATSVKRANRYEPEFTDLMNQLSLHYNTSIMATRVAKPRDKAAVEKAVHISYQRVYAPMRHQKHTSLEALNEAIFIQLDVHHARRFRNAEQSRKYIFQEQECHLLRTLPSEHLEIKQSVMAKVGYNYHVILGQDGHLYSVSYKYVGKQVKIIYTSSVVEIYHEHQRIAFHARNIRRNGYTTIKEHMPTNHQYQSIIQGWTGDDFKTKARKLSPDVELAIDHLLGTHMFPEQVYRTCLGIIRLADKYGASRLGISCSIALKVGKITYGFINNILKNNMDLKHASPILPAALPLHQNIRGPEAYS